MNIYLVYRQFGEKEVPAKRVKAESTLEALNKVNGSYHATFVGVARG